MLMAWVVFLELRHVFYLFRNRYFKEKKLTYRFPASDFILRDWLALDRTILANERTLLSFTRTALVLILAGMTLIRFFGAHKWAYLGYAALCAGVVLWMGGFRVYHKKKRDYAHALENNGGME